MKTTDIPVVVEQLFKIDTETVWRAITDIEQMTQWYFENIPSFKPEVGFETEFTVENEGRVFPHIWKVTEAIPGKKLTYTWRFGGYEGDSYVSFELFPDGESTRLRVTATVTEDFTADVPEFTRENCLGGWEYFIQQRLKGFLEDGD